MYLRTVDKKPVFELRPFDTLACLRNQPIGLPLSVAFRTVNWEEVRRELEEAGFLETALGRYAAAA